jgi:endonuclease YncB( thermonuclease family)
MPAPEPGLVARGVIDRVIDGDTVDVLITIPVRVRLLRINAEETRGPEKEIGLKWKALMEKLAPEGSRVLVHIPSGHVDALAGVFTFGRVLGDVWREGDDENLSDAMERSGVKRWES